MLKKLGLTARAMDDDSLMKSFMRKSGR